MATLESFLFLYFFQLEKELKANTDLLSVKFQSEEANTDEELKKYMKNYISNHSKISISSEISSLTIQRGVDSITVNTAELLDFEIEKVWLPHELTEDLRHKIAAEKRSVYVNPDLYFQIRDKKSKDMKSLYVSVELKSTKNNTIPGSSVQQISPYEWVIFIQHSQNSIDAACGVYLNSITRNLPFPDRSPRPTIGFKNVKEWNSKNRTVKNGNLTYKIDIEEEEDKLKILSNWEEVLCDEWMETVQEKHPRTNEKWFNNTIRMYSLRLLREAKKNPDFIDKTISLLERTIK